MSFNAPKIIENIKEIKIIYELNDKRDEKLNVALKKVENNMTIDTATEELMEKWEAILKINKSDTDTLDERRFRVKSRIFQKLPYTIRGLRNKLDSLCGEDGYILEIDHDTENITCYVQLFQKVKLKEVKSMLDAIIPLNMTIQVKLKYNTWGDMKTTTWKKINKYKWCEVKEVVIDAKN